MGAAEGFVPQPSQHPLLLRKSHGSTAAFTGDLLQIHLQRKSQSQPHEESAEPKHTSCFSGDAALTTGNLVISIFDPALCGITPRVPDM